jgi:hypothetical protein
VFWCNADRLPPLLDGLLQWRKQPEWFLEVVPLSNKRSHLLEGGSALVLFFLAGLGGEGEDGFSGMAAMLRMWRVRDVQFWQDQDLHPLRHMEEKYNSRSGFFPSAAASRESRCGYPSTQDAGIWTDGNIEVRMRIAGS